MNNQEFVQSPSVKQTSLLPGIGELMRETFSIYKKKMKVFLILALLLLLAPLVIVSLPLIISILSLSFLSLSHDPFSFPMILLSIAFILLIAISFLALILINLWISVALLFAIKEREKQIGVKELFVVTRHKIASYFWISLLTTFATLGGFLLFIIPGIIISVWFVLAGVIFIAEGLKGTSALSRSKQLMKGRWWSVFWKFLVFNAIIMTISVIVSFIPLIGMFINTLIIPLSFIFSFLIYEKLKEINFIGYSENRGDIRENIGDIRENIGDIRKI